MRDRSVVHGELPGGDGEPLGGEVQQVGARLRGSLPNRRAREHHRHAPRRDQLLRPRGGVGRLDADALQRELELLRRDARDRRLQALPELDLAGPDGDGVLRIDPDPRVELLVLGAGKHGRHPVAACLTARSTRGCDPHRHRCGASASRISCVSRARRPVEERLRGDDDPRRAVAALGRRLVDEGLLQRM